jgi:circadian clock protein KaiC
MEAKRVLLKLFVSGPTARTSRAIHNLRRLCEEEFDGRYELAIIDVLEHPQIAEEEQVLATPTLIKQLPPPIRKIIGDLSDRERVLVGLAIDQKQFDGDRGAAEASMPGDAETLNESGEFRTEGSRTMIADDNREDRDGEGMRKLRTGIPGFDLIAQGGLPLGRTTLVAGTAGSAKTVFATQFLAEGIQKFGQAGVFVTFEETPDDIAQNLAAFNWDVRQWEREGKWAFVDASPHDGPAATEVGRFDLDGLLARIEHAVGRVGAERVAVDSLGAIFSQFSDRAIVRRELFRVARALKSMNVTSVITAEREHEYGDISRHSVEEFVSDNVIILRNVLEEEKRRRTMEILKFRGTSHQKGEWPFTIRPTRGIVGVPLSAIELNQRSSDERITSGVPELDEMCGGGFFRNSLSLVSGATGTGKTLLGTHFVGASAADDSRSLMFAFEESHDQLFRNAHGWGIDFAELERSGKLRVDCRYPEVSSLEDHLIRMKNLIAEVRPNRVVVDSLSALQRTSPIRTFREFVIGLSCYLKELEIAALFTAAAPDLMGGTTITEAHVSTITDSIILLRYVEIHGEMRRGATVLKMRGSGHDKDIREFTIDGTGMHMGKRFRNVSGILRGQPVHVSPDVMDRVGGMFRDDSLARSDGKL